jgi:hypothetical protein
MKKILLATALATLCARAFAGDVAVSINVGEPGFFGQIDIGNVPRPPVLYARPVVIERAPEYREAEPIYLHVPPGHEKHWKKHCREYNACGRPVYFVRDDWYNNEYVPRHREHDHGRDEGHDRGHHEGRDKGREHEHDRDHDRGDRDR